MARVVGALHATTGAGATPSLRSLITLKALTYAPTGGIVAAPTTSLPEQLGGVRNWDYRYCWLRDATFTLNALLLAGYTEEAVAWREWLLRAVAGSPADLQILYGVAGERRLDGVRAAAGCRATRARAPVRIGNAASKQFQLDVYGEVMDTLHLARAAGLEPDAACLEHPARVARVPRKRTGSEPDEGIWEVRGPRRHFTHSKVMAWVAFDRGGQGRRGASASTGPVERWRQRARRDPRAGLRSRASTRERNTLRAVTTARPHLDASLLLIPLVGFLPPDDPRVRGTVAAIERELVVDGLRAALPDRAAASTACRRAKARSCPASFWLADCLAADRPARRGRGAVRAPARRCATTSACCPRNTIRASGRMLGNFPQALTHMALINTARLLSMPQREIDRSSGRRRAASGGGANRMKGRVAPGALNPPRRARRPGSGRTPRRS